MLRRLTLILVSGIICLLGAESTLAQRVWSTLQEYEKVTGQRIEKFGEAPMLRVKVAAGEIPPVEERLPEEPVVIAPVEEIGQYGGTLHTFNTKSGRPGDGAYAIGYEPLLHVASDISTILPNVAKKWDFSKDGKTLTLYLRKGVKWSDGAPFTADDVMFWWEDIMLNKELTPVLPTQFRPGGEPMKVEKVDDYTVRLHFTVPAPSVLPALSFFWTGHAPKHYLKKFHIKYNAKANELAKKNGFEAWYEYFQEKRRRWATVPLSVGLPTLHAFKLVEKGPDYLLYERNPYYWKVDTEGNQLPYIDKILVRIVENIEIYNGKIMSGEADFAMRQTTFVNYTLYKENEERGGYRVLKWPYCQAETAVSFFPCLNYKEDPVLTDIFRDVRFRRALALAINREEINETFFHGLAEPRNHTVIKTSKLYEPRFAQAYIQYDPDKANRLLDEMGLRWDENHEYRLRPDGKRLGWVVEHGGGAFGAYPEIPEMVAEYWKKIGIDMTPKLEDWSLVSMRMRANKLPMFAEGTARVTDLAFKRGQISEFVPYTDYGWAVEWGRWYETNGESGEEPPEEIKKLQEWREKMLTTMNEEEWIQLGKKIVASQAENLWTIGTVGLAPKPVIAANNLRNVPESLLCTWQALYTMPAHPEQFFLKQK